MTCFFLAVTIPVALAADSRAGETAVRLNVQPMAAPKPALKYLLLPEVREMNPGNAAQWYVRCFQEQRNFFFSKEGNAARARYRAMSLAELRKENLRQYGGFALTQADWAARLDTVDWEVLQRVQTEGLDLTLPELGPIEILATALQVRLRAQVAGQHFDEAVGTAKTMFALARHLGEYPSGAANRIGLSTAHLALDALQEMLQQPGCPNLYWALTDLPCPLVDLRKGLQGDSALVAAELRSLRDDAPMTEAEVEKVVGRLSGALGFGREQAGQPLQNLRARLRARVKNPEQVRAARRRLIDAGSTEGLVDLVQTVLLHYWDGSKKIYADQVLRFPPAQVILLDEKRAYEIGRDEALKLLALAPWQIDVLTSGRTEREGEALFADLMPQVIKLRRQQAGLEQRIGLLRHVEALRLYAAAHDGRLPQKLADVSVPLPDDPFTGKPFGYKLDKATAHLRGTRPPADAQNRGYTGRYEVIIHKSQDRGQRSEVSGRKSEIRDRGSARN
jgi:hypothetical protein